MNILEIVPKENAILHVISEDGQTGFFDVTPYLQSEAFAPLKDFREFQRVRNGKYFVEWDCGADVSADTVFARWTLHSPGSPQSVLSELPDQQITGQTRASEPGQSGFIGDKSYDVEIIRREFNQAYAPWSKEDDVYLRKRFLEGAKISDLVSEFGRQPGGIRSRLRKLKLGL